MNACTKFYGNPSNSFGDISPKPTNVNFMVALEEKLRGEYFDTSSGKHGYLYQVL